MGERVSYEEDISTQQNKEEAFPRIQGPYVQQDRESDSEEEERQGTEENRLLNGEGLGRGEVVRRSSELRDLLRQGKALRGRWVTVIHRRGRRRRAGFVLKRDLKGAVSRNKVKRRLKEIYRREKRRIDPQVEIVFLADRRTKGADYCQLREDVLQTLGRAGILKNG